MQWRRIRNEFFSVASAAGQVLVGFDADSEVDEAQQCGERRGMFNRAAGHGGSHRSQLARLRAPCHGHAIVFHEASCDDQATGHLVSSLQQAELSGSLRTPMKSIAPFTLTLPLLLAMPAGISACSSTRTVGERTDDAVIKTRVGSALTTDPDVKRLQIDVDVLDGVVTLRGAVDNAKAAEEAVRLAESTEGVKRVVNELQIVSPNDDGSNDSDILGKVGAKLRADPDIERFDIDVDVVNGVVYLSGIVENEQVKQKAERLATDVEGVLRVQNDLKVGGDAEAKPNDGQQPAE